MELNLNKETKYLVGASGGPDSMFLLNELVKKEMSSNIIACHVNYNYRSDSNVDQEILKNYCLKNNIKLEILNIEQDYSKFKLNFEAWAREKRYDFFIKISNKYNIKNLLIAHNQNDVIETFILQKERKNYVKKFGLAKISKFKSLLIIRPMLEMKKTEILNSLKEEKINYAIDSSNFDLKFKRNEIRSKLKEEEFETYLKQIEVYNKDLKKLSLEVEWYVNNNHSADELIINKTLINSEIEFIQRCVYQWLELIKMNDIVQKRSNKTIYEIAKNIKGSMKPFWQVQVGEYFIVKDYDRLFLIKSEVVVPKTFLINSASDLYKAEQFINWLDIVNIIKKDNENYPYTVSNNFNWYKTNTFIGNKKTNRYFIDKKIRYKNRMLKGVVIKNSTSKILNRIK